MKKLTIDSPEAKSLDLVAANIAKLKALFPELLTESKGGAAVNVDVLKQLVGDATVTDADEKYGLTWNGKRKARLEALKPSTGTLRPAKGDSVDWDTTQNIMIEGDNLEVLKLLQKSYANQVKLIYIDPPYNTGKDFVYPDDYQDNLRNYQMRIGTWGMEQNVESSGRFHTNWLNMMFPRLHVAKNLLASDGLLFASISDAEVHNLRAVLDEVFGDANFIGNIIWNSTKSVTNTALISVSHTHTLVYARDIEHYTINRSHFRLPEDGEGFSNPDNDPRGPWKADPFQVGGERPNQLYEITNPTTGETYRPNPGCSWKNEYKVFLDLMKEKRIVFGVSGEAGPQRKRFLTEAEERGKVSKTLWDDIDTTANATKALLKLMGNGVFSNPKPVELLTRCIQLGTHNPEGAIVMDFFAGSGTTGHAVWAQNIADGGSRKFILVQLPETLNPDNKEQSISAKYCDELNKPRSIAELTKERLRRAAKSLKAENPLYHGDLGFRVFKLDTSNLKAWDPHTANVRQSLLDAAEHIKPDRTADDLLYELLLKKGLDLAVPIEQKTIEGKEVVAIGGGVMLVCMAETIDLKSVEPLAFGIADWHLQLAPSNDKEAIVVFRDNAFSGNVAKSNIAAILEQRGLRNIQTI